jgi:hypothetical protein
MRAFDQPIQSHTASSKAGRDCQLQTARGPGLTIVWVLACVLAVLSACQKAEIKPLDVATGDTCYRCRAPITEKHFAAEFITKDGFVRKFDDVSCMSQHATKVGRKNIEAYFVADFPSQKWLKAEEAYFVQSEQISTPKNSGILAFADEGQAKAVAGQYQAKLITLNDLLK